jgi:PQQ-like domain
MRGMRRLAPRRVALAVGLAAGLAACQGGDSAGSGGPTGGTRPAPPRTAAGARDWPAFGVDAARTNVQPAATGIRPADLRGVRPRVVELPGTVDSSPVFLHAVRIGERRRDAFFMTTTYGRTLAVSPAGRILWTYTPPGYASVAGTAQITTATPVADPSRRFLYAASPDGRIHKLAVASGAEVTTRGWPVAVTRLPAREKIASALNLAGGRLYVTTGGYVGDAPPYQGHVVAIDPASGAIIGVWNSLCADRPGLLDPATCPDSDSAIWGRAGAVVDPATGDLLVATGNGRFDGATAWGDSVVELNPAVSRVVASYTPANQAELEASDADLGSSAPAILRSAGPLVAQAGKDGLIRLIDLGRAPPGRTGGELQRLPSPGGADVFTAMGVWRHAGTAWLFVADGAGTAAYRLAGAPGAPRLQRAWSVQAAGTSPVLAGGLLYVYDPGGALNVYRPASGRPVAQLPAEPGHWNSPIVAAGVIALPTGDANDHATTGRLLLY